MEVEQMLPRINNWYEYKCFFTNADTASRIGLLTYLSDSNIKHIWCTKNRSELPSNYEVVEFFLAILDKLVIDIENKNQTDSVERIFELNLFRETIQVLFTKFSDEYGWNKSEPGMLSIESKLRTSMVAFLAKPGIYLPAYETLKIPIKDLVRNFLVFNRQVGNNDWYRAVILSRNFNQFSKDQMCYSKNAFNMVLEHLKTTLPCLGEISLFEFLKPDEPLDPWHQEVIVFMDLANKSGRSIRKYLYPPKKKAT